MTRHVLISVSDYTGLAELTKELSQLGFVLVASLGNAIYPEKHRVPVTRIQKITKYKPMMMPRGIKSIHHLIFAGILADRKNKAHMREIERYGITPFDMVVCNFYPFKKMVTTGAAERETMQSIDIGGPAMVRCAAKNYKNVIVVTDTHDYSKLLRILKKNGSIPLETRRRLAIKAFRYTKNYDDTIAKYLTSIHSLR